SDPDSFVQIGQSIGRDKKRVYFGRDGVVPRDIGSFKLLGHQGWAKDDLAYYWKTREVNGADLPTFAIFDSQPVFARDKNYIYWRGWRIDGCDSQSFSPVKEPGMPPGWNKGKTSEYEYTFREINEHNTTHYKGPPKMEVTTKRISTDKVAM